VCQLSKTASMAPHNWSRGRSGNGLPVVDPNVANMTGNPVAGRNRYNAECGSCHSKDGPGRGEYRRGEGRPRVPALWGKDGYSRGAAAAISVTARIAASTSLSLLAGPMLMRTVPRGEVPMKSWISGAHCRPVRVAML